VENPSTSRLASVDALRGFDMFWIIGGDYLLRSLPKIRNSSVARALAAQMEHCEWAGLHFYDLIFPLFVFLVGVSLVFSLTKTIARDGRAAALKRIALRSGILFLLGVIYMGGIANGFKNVYLAGVLQRIAVAYFFAASLFCFLSTRSLAVICFSLLLGYWALMTFVPVPGVGPPALDGPGRNLAHYLDERFLPGQKFEGTLLSTMAAVANCLLGVFAGLLLRAPAFSDRRKVAWLAGTGVAGIASGWLWSLHFPIIKLLWTSSYVLVTCGISALLLALFFQVIEVWKVRRWAQPFIWIGTNPITIYIVAGIVNFHHLALRFTGGDIRVFLGRYADSVQALVTIAFGLLLVRYLYRRQIFLRL
jgi:predicted acyltransferase